MAVAITDDIHCEVLGEASCVILLQKEEPLTGSFSLKVLKTGETFDISKPPGTE
jgi:hypothetical protein